MSGIGMGSGICGLITARDLLGLKTEIVGVVARDAPAMTLSFAAEAGANKLGANLRAPLLSWCCFTAKQLAGSPHAHKIVRLSEFYHLEQLRIG
jgi:hypothetical protein